MKDVLTAFITATLAEAGKGNAVCVKLGDRERGRLMFGMGGNLIVWWPPSKPGRPYPPAEDVTVEEAVEKYLAAFVMGG